MKDKLEVIQKAQELITPLVIPHVPEGTEVQAVVDQWIHAIATDSALYCKPDIVEPNLLKKNILSLFKLNNIFENERVFFNKTFESIVLKPRISPSFRFVDLFAGVGGLRLGFQNSGGVCVFSSELDKKAQATYKKNHGELPFGDITLIKPKEIPNHDVLLAGFPCQPFSHAGLKGGIADTRGTLFHSIAKILDVKRPKFALLENVRGIISHDRGHTLKVILNSLTSIGYSCNIPKDVIQNGTTKEIQELAKKMVLKSIDFGVPQNRQRIYIVLWRDDEIEHFTYPMPTHTKTTVGEILDKVPDSKLTISDRLWAGHQRRKKQNKIDGKGFGYGIVSSCSPYTNTISARYYKDGSEALVEQKGLNPRKLSTREVARLQGFPEEFILSSSSVQAYKQFGNSVTVSVITELAKEISKNIK